jgi:hypothetical protein
MSLQRRSWNFCKMNCHDAREMCCRGIERPLWGNAHILWLRLQLPTAHFQSTMANVAISRQEFKLASECTDHFFSVCERFIITIQRAFRWLWPRTSHTMQHRLISLK